ncbi:MAG: hypothetical protein ACREXW_14370 [Gammaproteobacteria bacterium]
MAGLALEGEEHDPVGRARPLAGVDEDRAARVPAVGEPQYLAGGLETQAREQRGARTRRDGGGA